MITALMMIMMLVGAAVNDCVDGYRDGDGYCDIQDNQGGGRGHQLKPRLRLLTLTETLIILDITKTDLIIVLLYIERKK